MHPGHIDLLNKARSLGDYLMVGVNSDRSVRALKGEGRPIINENARRFCLSSLKSVDFVFIFDGEDFSPYISLYMPDIYCKGPGYTFDSLTNNEKKVLTENNVQFVSIKGLSYPDISTTKIEAKIRGG
jgi:rfaE bifunctional protein nucleotidyltransferase chain/domain